MPPVAIVLGSKSDAAAMEECARTLDRMGIDHETHVISAHRSPEKLRQFALEAPHRGVQVIIAAAGMAAHLAGAMAASSILPVIGVPLPAEGGLNGLDALLSTVQMPPGVPVATVAIGKPGAKNAAILAVQILARFDPALRDKLIDFKKNQAKAVQQKDAALG